MLYNFNMDKKNLKISAKKIGEVNMPDFCPRCFWIKLQTKWKLPYQVFPAIFSSIDSYTKKMTNGYYDSTGEVPPWFEDYGFVKPVETPTLGTFKVLHEKTGILLRGVPDEMFLNEDGSYSIIDYKTAPYTPNVDHLMPIYESQLNAYAYIAERIGFKPVTGLYLAYYDPATDVDENIANEYSKEDGMLMKFNVHMFKLKINSSIIHKSLDTIKTFHDMETPPPFNDSCDSCKALRNIMSLV